MNTLFATETTSSGIYYDISQVAIFFANFATKNRMSYIGFKYYWDHSGLLSHQLEVGDIHNVIIHTVCKTTLATGSYLEELS